MRRAVIVGVIAGLGAAGCKGEPRPEPRAAPRAPTRYLKGQTHVHTDNSGDSATAPADVARWYAQHGFDFIVFTDHNVVTTFHSDLLLTIPGVELTQNLADCHPPPTTQLGCLLHVNALFVDAAADQPVRFPAPTSVERLALFQTALDITRELGAIAQLNHPNMAWALDAALATELVRRGALLMEIANQNERDSNVGDADHPSTEALWDRVLSTGATVYGIASDDAHHYDDAAAVRARGRPAFTGDLGYVMVRADPDVASIRRAIVAGDFYSTTGVHLDDVHADRAGLVIEIHDDGGAPYLTTFIGEGGAVLATSRELVAIFELTGAPSGYVRATVVDRTGRTAWIQPVRVP